MSRGVVRVATGEKSPAASAAFTGTLPELPVPVSTVHETLHSVEKYVLQTKSMLLRGQLELVPSAVSGVKNIAASTFIFKPLIMGLLLSTRVLGLVNLVFDDE